MFLNYGILLALLLDKMMLFIDHVCACYVCPPQLHKRDCVCDGNELHSAVHAISSLRE